MKVAGKLNYEDTKMKDKFNLDDIELPSNEQLKKDTKSAKTTLQLKHQWSQDSEKIKKRKEKVANALRSYVKSDAGKEKQKQFVKLSQTDEIREKRSRTKKERGLVRDSNIYMEIYNESWSADRGRKLFEYLSEKYNIPIGTVTTIVNGTMIGTGVETVKIEGHDQRLKQWQLDYGNLQWWWKVTYPDNTTYKIFETQSDAGRWACEFAGKPIKNKHTAIGYAFGLFKNDKPMSKKSDKFAGFKFEKINRKTNIVENKKDK